MLQGDFPATAPAANPVFYRTYSRKTATGRESWKQVVERNLAGLKTLGQLNDDEIDLMRRMQLRQASLPSGRWLWMGGTPWIEAREFFGLLQLHLHQLGGLGSLRSDDGPGDDGLRHRRHH